MNIEQMEQNAALELFRYLKEHLIPLAKNKNDKIFESDVTIQITRSINKDIWNCEEEVKQLLSKTESRSVMISCIIDHALAKSNNGFLVQEYIIDLDDIGKSDEKKIHAQFEELFKRASVIDSYCVPPCGIPFKKMADALSYIKAKTGVDMKVVQADKTNLDMIRTMDKFHLALLLSHIRTNNKDYPVTTTSWCEWLDKNWNAILCI